MSIKTMIQERRVNTTFRKRVEAMSREELIQALLTDELTGLPNMRAYSEDTKLPIQVMADLDGLKYVNDTFGYEAGDDMIRRMADACKAVGARCYRSNTSGDEFIFQFPSFSEAQLTMNDLQDILKDCRFCVNSVIPGHTLQGIGVSYGIGSSLDRAEAQLKGMKARRKEEGKLANRGGCPHYLKEVRL